MILQQVKEDAQEEFMELISNLLIKEEDIQIHIKIVKEFSSLIQKDYLLSQIKKIKMIKIE